MKYSNFKKSVIGSMLALALITTAVPAPRAQAATLQELQAQIQVLLAQLQALQSQSPGSNNSTSCSLFVSDMTLGRSGGEVTNLQNFLISRGHTIPAGATGYFGEQTRSALAQFQLQNGVSPAVGYFGPLTRGKVNALCAVVPVPQPPAPNDPDNSNGDSNQNELKGGEASLKKYDAKSGDDTNLEEGQKNVSVMDVSFDVEDSDIRINRIDVAFTPDNTNNEKDPWDTFTEVSLWNGNDRIGKVDASNEDNWEEDSPSNGDYRLRLNGLNWIVREDDSAEFSVRVSTHKNIKGAADGEVWNIFIPNNGIRAIDALKTNLYMGDSAESVSIDIDEAGSDDELIVKRSNEDPDSTTLQLKDNARSGWTTVFAFDIDTDDSTSDIEIRKLPIELTVSSSTVDTFMRDIRINVDGKTYTKKTITNGVTNTVLFEFSKNELVIDAGDRATVEVEIDFKQLASLYEGTTIVGTVNTSGIVAEGADDLSSSQISGAATGEIHTLRTSGAILKSKNTSATSIENSNNTKEDNEGSYTIKFEVTAFDRDIFIAKSAERGSVLGTAGVNFVIEDTSAEGAVTASGTVAAALSSNAKSESGFYKVSEGETKEFTLLVEYDPEYQSFFNVQLHSLNWSTNASAPIVQQLALPAHNFETTVLSIGN